MRPAGRRLAFWVSALGTLAAVVAIAGPAFAHGRTRGQATAPAASAAEGGQRGLAQLAVRTARMSCAELAATTAVSGQRIQVAHFQIGSATPGSPRYCALTGHIDTYVGFEILLPISTWRRRYLQIGCGGLCGTIGVDAPETTGFQALADGDFVVAGQDEGHSGTGTGWYANPAQRVDFAYRSDHVVAEVSKGLARRFYGLAPRFSYFDGCSQGGHQALAEAQRFPDDFDGILAGAPASIMTELNSVLHEYEFRTVVNASGQAILSEAQAQTVLRAALRRCDARVGLMLDYRQCEREFRLSSVRCTAANTGGCLSGAQIAAVRRILAGPVDAGGTKLYPDGYSLASAFLWDNGTGPNIPATLGQTTAPGTFITDWYRYFAFERDLGPDAVGEEPFTQAEFRRIERLAPFWDDTDPYLQPFARDGGKLILWQGTGDWSIPTDSSLAYYQAVVRASGGLAKASRFSRYYQLPSVGHCGGNGPDTYAGLQKVAQWVETGRAPRAVIARQYQAPSTAQIVGLGGAGSSGSDLTDAVPALGAGPSGAFVRSLRVFPYPEVPVYTGHGSVDRASSFTGRNSRALQDPLPWAGSFDNLMIFCDTAGRCHRRRMAMR